VRLAKIGPEGVPARRGDQAGRGRALLYRCVGGHLEATADAIDVWNVEDQRVPPHRLVLVIDLDGDRVVCPAPRPQYPSDPA